MMKNKKNFPGMDGFVWWTGIVEGRDDPLKLARIQVRCFGWHTEEKQMIPSDELLWAQPAFAANAYQTTHVPKEGETVFGFFMDGEDAQFPFYFGVIPAIPGKLYPQDKGFSDPATDVNKRPIPMHIGKSTRYPAKEDIDEPTTSRLARAENLSKTPLGRAFEIVYGAKYPYNCSTMTESGHYFDLDDTPGKEAIRLLHRTGSYFEICPNGDVRIYSINNVYITAKENVIIRALNQNIEETAKIDIKEKAGKDISETAGDNISEKAGKDISETAGINIVEKATKIFMN